MTEEILTLNEFKNKIKELRSKIKDEFHESNKVNVNEINEYVKNIIIKDLSSEVKYDKNDNQEISIKVNNDNFKSDEIMNYIINQYGENKDNKGE